MSRPLAAGQPGTAVAGQPNVIAAAPVRYADVTTPRLNFIPIPFAGAYPTLGTPPPAPYPANFYPMGPPSPFTPVMPPGTFPGPRANLHPPPPPGVLGPYPGTPPVTPPGTFPGPRVDLHTPPPPPPPGVLGPYPGTPSLPTVNPMYITQYPVCPRPPGFSPSLIYTPPPPGVVSHQGPGLIHGIVDPLTMTRPSVPPVAPVEPPPGVVSHQGPVLIHGIVDPVTMTRPPVPPVAPVDTPTFKIYIGKIAATVDNDFVLSLLQVCGVVKSWEPVTNPIDGTPTGFGFCEFESAEGSLRAMRLLNKLSVDGQELVINVNQATRDYFQKYGGSTPEEKAKEAETERMNGVVSSADNGNDLSRAILDVTRRGAVVMQRIRSLIEGETKRCQNGTYDADKDVMRRIHSLIEERMKSKLPGSPTLAVQVPACIVDENDDDDTGSGALEERKIRRQCEQEKHLGEMKAVGSEGQKDSEMTAAGMSSLQIGEAPSMHVPRNCESTVEHERKSQHREGDGFRKRNGEEKSMQRKAVGSEGQKDREVTAAGKYSLQIDEAPSMHVRMECESAVEHDRKSQLRGRDGFRKSNGEEKDRERKAVGSEAEKDREVAAAGKSSLQLDVTPLMHVPTECESTVEHERKNQHMERDGFTKSKGEEKRIVFVPGLVLDKQNISAGEKVGFESQAASNSADKKQWDAKQLLATVPKTKEELFAHDVNWEIYDKYGLRERMRPWISRKASEVFGEELAEFVDYVVASTKEHVMAPRMLELLESLLDDDAEKFILLMWRKLIFEIKKSEEGLV